MPSGDWLTKFTWRTAIKTD